MADTKVHDLTNGVTKNATDEIPAIRSPYGSGDDVRLSASLFESAGATAAALKTYISGCIVTRSSATAIAVSAGTYWDDTVGGLVTYAGGTNSPTLGASTHYSVFLANGAIEVFGEAPPSTTYAGNSRKRATGNGGRYIGSFYTNASSQVYTQQVNEIGSGHVSLAYLEGTTAAPFRVLSAGTNATYSTITSLVGVVPRYVSDQALIVVYGNLSTAANDGILVELSMDGTNPGPSLNAYVRATASYPRTPLWCPLSSSTPGLYYKVSVEAAGTGPNAFIDVIGYRFTR